MNAWESVIRTTTTGCDTFLSKQITDTKEAQNHYLREIFRRVMIFTAAEDIYYKILSEMRKLHAVKIFHDDSTLRYLDV